MSKGNEIITFRCDPETLAEVHDAVSRHNRRTRGAIMSRSEWILYALRHKIKHMRRSRIRRNPPVVTTDIDSGSADDYCI